MHEPIPFYGWLETSEDTLTTFITEDRERAMINVIRVGYKTLEEAAAAKANTSTPDDYYIVQLRDKSIMSTTNDVLAYYIIHKNQEL
jgi:hypothetical protein